MGTWYHFSIYRLWSQHFLMTSTLGNSDVTCSLPAKNKLWSHHFNSLGYCDVTPPPPPLRRLIILILWAIVTSLHHLHHCVEPPVYYYSRSSCVSSRSSASFKNTKCLPKLTFRNTSEWSSFSLEIVDPGKSQNVFLRDVISFEGGNYGPRDHTIMIKLYSYERLNNTHFRFGW